MKIDLETIRKMWVMLATTGLIQGLNWVPEYIKVLFSDAGTDMTFNTVKTIIAAVSAVVGWWQFTKGRTGEGKPQQLKRQEGSNIGYLLNPFASA